VQRPPLGSRHEVPLAAYRLPRGRHGIPPEQVAENQRWRLLGAAAEVMAERGYLETTSARIARRAAVSSSAFYKHFENVSACLTAAFELAAENIVAIVSDSCRTATDRDARLGAAIGAVLEFLAADPAFASLLGDVAPAADPAFAAARTRLFDRLAAQLRDDRVESPVAVPGTPALEPRLLAAAFALASERIADHEPERLRELASQLAELLAAPATLS
jgi:AcrR family transcriptional regulator